MLTRFASVEQKPQQHKSISEEALKLVDQALSQDRCTVAGSSRLANWRLMKPATARDKELTAQAEGRFAEVAELAAAFGRVKAAELVGKKAR